MPETVLVADRGLGALRVMAACRAVGSKSIAVYVTDDADAAHVRTADEAISLGDITAPDVPALVEAATVTGAQAIHPGGGVLARDPVFAQGVLDAGLLWLGAPPGSLSASPDTAETGSCVEVHGGVLYPVPGMWRETARRGGRALVLESGGGGVSHHGRTPWLRPADRLIELMLGVDLVERGLRAADGAELAELTARPGWAVQVLLYAGTGALVPVVIDGVALPTSTPTLIVDTVLLAGAHLTRHDTPLLAVLTASGTDRSDALHTISAALAEVSVASPPLELADIAAVVADSAFRRGEPSLG